MTEETLFDRAICGEASEADWAQLNDSAVADPAVWHRLALGLRDNGRLVQAMAEVGDAAEAVELVRPSANRRRWIGAAGWLAAAALALAWVGMPSPPPIADAEVPPEAAAAELVGELPSVLMETRELPDGGGVEVTYLRRLIERRTTAAVFEHAEDELGEPIVVPADLTQHLPQEL